MKPKHERRRRREERRKEWNAMKVVFLLAGGHKDWIIPFNMNWRNDFGQMTRSLEAGNTFYAKPRYNYGQWRDEYPAISNAWNKAALPK